MKEVLQGGLCAFCFSALAAARCVGGRGGWAPNAGQAPDAVPETRREGVKRAGGDVTSFA